MANMRQAFSQALYTLMAENKNVYLLMGDLGYGLYDIHREEFPDRALNMGASEQAMMGAAVGLALSGKIPFVYSITPFLLARPFETLRTYVAHENVPVKLIGSGRGQDYAHDGFSHYAGDDESITVALGIESYWPKDPDNITVQLLRDMVRCPRPEYLNLQR